MRAEEKLLSQISPKLFSIRCLEMVIYMSSKDLKNNECIYIILIKSLTGLGKLSRRISKYDYSHIAVSFDEKLNDFLTFSRKKHYSPFQAGFMHEKREYYAFEKNERVKVKVFKIPVSRSDFNLIKDYIYKIENDKEYIFNLYSMLTMPVFHGIEIYKAHNCMSFVSKVIELSNSVLMKKKYYKYDIKEIDEFLAPYFYKEYYLEKEEAKEEAKEDTYMKRDNLVLHLKYFFELNGKLLYRMVFKDKCKSPFNMLQ